MLDAGRIKLKKALFEHIEEKHDDNHKIHLNKALDAMHHTTLKQFVLANIGLEFTCLNCNLSWRLLKDDVTYGCPECGNILFPSKDGEIL